MAISDVEWARRRDERVGDNAKQIASVAAAHTHIECIIMAQPQPTIEYLSVTKHKNTLQIYWHVNVNFSMHTQLMEWWCFFSIFCQYIVVQINIMLQSVCVDTVSYACMYYVYVVIKRLENVCCTRSHQKQQQLDSAYCCFDGRRTLVLYIFYVILLFFFCIQNDSSGV